MSRYFDCHASGIGAAGADPGFVIAVVVLRDADVGANMPIISSHNVRDGKPSRRHAISSAMISDSDDECEVAPCFLHNHEIGT